MCDRGLHPASGVEFGRGYRFTQVGSGSRSAGSRRVRPRSSSRRPRRCRLTPHWRRPVLAQLDQTVFLDPPKASTRPRPSRMSQAKRMLLPVLAWRDSLSQRMRARRTACRRGSNFRRCRRPRILRPPCRSQACWQVCCRSDVARWLASRCGVARWRAGPSSWPLPTSASTRRADRLGTYCAASHPMRDELRGSAALEGLIALPSI